MELIFSMLGEAAAAEIACRQDTQGFVENKGAARKSGQITGGAMEIFEVETGARVSTPENCPNEP